MAYTKPQHRRNFSQHNPLKKKQNRGIFLITINCEPSMTSAIIGSTKKSVFAESRFSLKKLSDTEDNGSHGEIVKIWGQDKSFSSVHAKVYHWQLEKHLSYAYPH